MRRAALLLACALGLLAVPASSADEKPPWTRAVYIVNDSAKITDAELADALPAFQASVSEDLKRYWNVDARLVLGAPPSPRSWTLTLSDEPDCLFCAGYHWQKLGVPFARVFVLDDVPWQIVLTHELQEMLVDPHVNRAALGGHTFRLVEVSDPVEAGQFAYQRPSASGAPVQISDFATERWYTGGLRRGPFDFAGHVHRPLQLLNEGYVTYWSGTGWAQEFASLRPRSQPVRFPAARADRRIATFPTSR